MESRGVVFKRIETTLLVLIADTWKFFNSLDSSSLINLDRFSEFELKTFTLKCLFASSIEVYN